MCPSKCCGYAGYRGLVAGDQERRPQWERSQQRVMWSLCLLGLREGGFESSFMFSSALWDSGDGEVCVKHHGGSVWRNHTKVQDAPGCSLCWTGGQWHKGLDKVTQTSGHCTQRIKGASGCTE